MLVASTHADFAWALLAGLVSGLAATALWTALMSKRQRRNRQRALEAFVGPYESQRRGCDEIDRLRITRDGDELSVELENKRGPASGRITLSDRFPKSGRGAYEHHFYNGDLGWGTWDVNLTSTGGAILVTTRYPHPERQVEVVQGYEWRPVIPDDAGGDSNDANPANVSSSSSSG